MAKNKGWKIAVIKQKEHSGYSNPNPNPNPHRKPHPHPHPHPHPNPNPNPNPNPHQDHPGYFEQNDITDADV